MFAQQNYLKEFFAEHGWELIEERDTGDWWRPVEWKIRSLRSPTECTVLVGFHADEQLEDKTRAKFEVWMIRFALEGVPKTTARANFEMPIKNGWEKNKQKVWDGLTELRNVFSSINP